MTQSQKPRFVHQSDLGEFSTHFRGYTVAYTRCAAGVIFAFAMCSQKDKFEKSIGRRVSEARLSEYSERLHEFMHHVDESDSWDESIDKVGFDVDSHTGFICADVLRADAQVTFAIADHVDLNAMDFKHAYIASIIDKVMGDIIAEHESAW